MYNNVQSLKHAQVRGCIVEMGRGHMLRINIMSIVRYSRNIAISISMRYFASQKSSETGSTAVWHDKVS